MVKKSIEHILYERKYCLYSWYTRHQLRSIEEIRKSCVSTCIYRVSVSRIFNTYRNLYLTCIHIGRLCIYLSNKCFCEPFLQLKKYPERATFLDCAKHRVQIFYRQLWLVYYRHVIVQFPSPIPIKIKRIKSIYTKV